MKRPIHFRVDPAMGAEDFSYFLAQAPGALFRLGVKRGEMRPGHSPHFDLDEEALPIGTAILAESARRYLAAAFN